MRSSALGRAQRLVEIAAKQTRFAMHSLLKLSSRLQTLSRLNAWPRLLGQIPMPLDGFSRLLRPKQKWSCDECEQLEFEAWYQQRELADQTTARFKREILRKCCVN
jgi:hypothetical protein